MWPSCTTLANPPSSRNVPNTGHPVSFHHGARVRPSAPSRADCGERSGEMAATGDSSGALVRVTGGSGFIGSWLVRLLLDRGYTVHATVKNLHHDYTEPYAGSSRSPVFSSLVEDDGETRHLQALDGADTRLRLFQMDLLDPASITPAVDGAHGVFHLASPLTLHPTQDPEATNSPFTIAQLQLQYCLHTCTNAVLSGELLKPAVSGTLNVLRAAKDCGVARVMLMASQVAIVPNPEWPADKVIDDDSWADVELLKKHQHWYNVSKTLAEKAAWDFAAKEGFQLVALNPGLVLGPMLMPSPNSSLHMLLQILGGQRFDIDDFYIGCVDVRDVAQSAVVIYENTSAQGRHLCIESIERLIDFHDKLAEL
uniref:NAD-dependent epimerase/dehydratase domain-containing protein n=1 Tax=Oryza barthii TaxID=65489 RepID=A0A0D3EVS3_9ORYZ